MSSVSQFESWANSYLHTSIVAISSYPKIRAQPSRTRSSSSPPFRGASSSLFHLERPPERASEEEKAKRESPPTASPFPHSFSHSPFLPLFHCYSFPKLFRGRGGGLGAGNERERGAAQTAVSVDDGRALSRHARKSSRRCCWKVLFSSWSPGKRKKLPLCNSLSCLSLSFLVEQTIGVSWTRLVQRKLVLVN